ncbi:RrF2 family transcriptional regulator [Thalassococcus sp. BH17M4-6]|uniref:RrF2 family transcriptional regulator n=1 Tax=Thalassococcus sp. BH17M4-6 TaxID=3413148 RepID=UPI003BC8F60A
MRVTKRTNIAMRVLMYCAAHPDELVTKAEVSRACAASENHVAQIINQLAQLGYLHTRRGRHGGLELGRPADRIVIGEVFRAFEAPVPLAECFADADNTCPLTDACRLRGILSRAAEAFYATLDPVTLDALVCDNTALLEILAPERACTGPVGEVLV